MFSPEGYHSFNDMTDTLRDWANRIFAAYLFEQRGCVSPTNAFQNGESSDLLVFKATRELLKQDGLDLVDASEKDREKIYERGHDDDFALSLIFHCLLSKLLMDFDTLLTSSSGNVIRPDDYIFLHLDRLDWVYPRWPIRDTPELGRIYELFDKGGFNGHSLAERYCFLDYYTGTIKMKNNSISGFKTCSHFGEDAISQRYIEAQVEPFVSHAVVWKAAEFSAFDFAQYFESKGIIEERWRVPELVDSIENADTLARKSGAKPLRKLGAKPTGAKTEFFRRYPEGKPVTLSAEAIAAELTEAGYPISGRQVLNYAKEIEED